MSMYKEGVDFKGRHKPVWDAINEAIRAADDLLDHIEGKAKAESIQEVKE